MVKQLIWVSCSWCCLNSACFALLVPEKWVINCWLLHLGKLSLLYLILMFSLKKSWTEPLIYATCLSWQIEIPITTLNQKSGFLISLLNPSPPSLFIYPKQWLKKQNKIITPHPFPSLSLSSHAIPTLKNPKNSLPTIWDSRLSSVRLSI